MNKFDFAAIIMLVAALFAFEYSMMLHITFLITGSIMLFIAIRKENPSNKHNTKEND